MSQPKMLWNTETLREKLAGYVRKEKSGKTYQLAGWNGHLYKNQCNSSWKNDEFVWIYVECSCRKSTQVSKSRHEHAIFLSNLKWTVLAKIL